MSAASAQHGVTTTGPYGKPAVLITAVAVSAFIVGLDNTILNIALPRLRDDLGLSLTGLQWVGTSYILAFSSLMLVGGRLTDIFGRRNVLQAGMIVFVLASVLAGLSTSGEMLIACRVVQGIGGAMVLPASLAVLGADFEGEQRNIGVGVWTASIAVAIALGPIVGGAIIEVAHWGWVFFINLPIGIIAMFLIRASVPPETVRLPPRDLLLAKLDLPGLASSSLALMAITFYLVHGQDHGFSSIGGLFALFVFAAATVAYIRIERVAKFPLVDLSLFKEKIFWGGTLGQIIWGLGINGVLFFTSLFLQDVMGLSPLHTGLAYLPLALAVAISVPLAAKLATWWGTNNVVAFGMVLISIGLVMGVFIDRSDPVSTYLIGLTIVGIGSGLTTPMTAAIMDVVPENQMGVGAAVVSTAREISGILGIVGIGAILVVTRANALEAGEPPVDAFTQGYHGALLAATVVMAIGAVVCWKTLTTKAQALEFTAAKAAAKAAKEAQTGEHGLQPNAVLDATTPADLATAVAEVREAVHDVELDKR